MSESSTGGFGHCPRQHDQEWKQNQQAAAYALQHYSVLAQHAFQKGESPAQTRLKMMRIVSGLPAERPPEPKYRKK
ncbi:hypothetical protein VTP01DRAFT_252 [Rhizomucor pusillus]|uniref:uncharacterized protein n=1 Tax=Rhizomucor pusillus TaxID=4840 RepID=UPI0037447B9F